MPEGLEAEIWRRAAEPLVGRRLVEVVVDERVATPGLVEAVTGRRIEAVERRGKVVLLRLDAGPDAATASGAADEDAAGAARGVAAGAAAEVAVGSGSVSVGLHFGMTGRLIVDGRAAIERLTYASGADRAEWDRLVCRTDPPPPDPTVPALRFNDPRRLGRVSLDPDLSALGPDVFDLAAAGWGERLGSRRAAVKSLLLDQSVVAGLGNLCADEVLLHAGIAPRRSAASLTDSDLGDIARACRERLPVMLAAGGSTHGDLSPERRVPGGRCPFDGAELTRATIGGRTAVWCPRHQR